MAYPAMLQFLPVGFLGLMIAGMLAAYVSTISTHLNWGTSYLVHDLYRRFLATDASERHLVWVGRVVTALLMGVAAGTTFFLETARQSFELLLSIGAGTGLLYLLRWFWWRINAWSEIAAMVSSFVVSLGWVAAARAGHPVPSHLALVGTVGVTTLVWVAATLLTSPTDRRTLVRFYKLVRPAGPGWRDVAAEAAVGPSPDSLPQAFLAWTLGCAFIYAALFGTGALLYGNVGLFAMWAMLFVASGLALARMLWRMRGEERA